MNKEREIKKMKKINNFDNLMELTNLVKENGWALELDLDYFVLTNLNSKINSTVFINNQELANEKLDYNVFVDDFFFEMDIEHTMRELRANYTWQEINELIQNEYQQALKIKHLVAQWYKGE